MNKLSLSRRTAIGSAVAFAGAPALSSRALGFLPELLLEVPEIVDLFVSIWRGSKVGREVVAGARETTLIEEINKFYGVGKFIIASYYEFSKKSENDLGQGGGSKIGCSGTNNGQSPPNTLCLEASPTAVLLAPGHLLGLKAAEEKLRDRVSQDAIGSYTKPIRLWRAVEPWQPIGTNGERFKSDVQYYTEKGSVALRWLITDRDRGLCRADFKVRDNSLPDLVVEGQTVEFSF